MKKKIEVVLHTQELTFFDKLMLLAIYYGTSTEEAFKKFDNEVREQIIKEVKNARVHSWFYSV